MPRTLSPDERALWRRVTADVRRADKPVVEPANPPAAMPAPVVQPKIPAIRHAPKPTAPTKIGTTLDHSWDRRLQIGGVAPDRIADLHGLRLEAAHRRAVETVEAAARSGDRLVLLITGRAPAAGSNRLDQPLRGIIRASIEDWLAASPMAGSIAAIRPAHQRHGGAGALYVILRRTARDRSVTRQKLS